MFGVLSTNSALIGLIGTLVTALISLAGIYYKSTHDREANKEQRYEDGLWKTINMLTSRVENLDKKIAEQDEVIDTLRKSNWDIRDKLSVAESSVREMHEDLERTQVSLKHTETLLNETQEALKAAQASLIVAQEEVQELREREQALRSEADVLRQEAENLRKRLATLEGIEHNESTGAAG